jgi:hypothetical protein
MQTPVMSAPIFLAFSPHNLRQTHSVSHAEALIYTFASGKELLVNNSSIKKNIQHPREV